MNLFWSAVQVQCSSLQATGHCYKLTLLHPVIACSSATNKGCCWELIVCCNL